MNILAIDTSGLYLSIAVARNDNVIAQFHSRQKKSHSDILAMNAGRLLKQTRIKPEALDLYAISIGPGSFTGLRIGVAFIKGMNLFFNKPVVGVPSLDLLANNVKTKSGIICPLVDAKRQNVYTAIYQRSKKKQLKRISEYAVIPISEALKNAGAVLETGRPVVFTGDGIGIYKKEILHSFGRKAEFAQRRFWYSKAGAVAKIGYRMYNENKYVIRDSARLAPMYLYPADIQCKKR